MKKADRLKVKIAHLKEKREQIKYEHSQTIVLYFGVMAVMISVSVPAILNLTTKLKLFLAIFVILTTAIWSGIVLNFLNRKYDKLHCCDTQIHELYEDLKKL